MKGLGELDILGKVSAISYKRGLFYDFLFALPKLLRKWSSTLTGKKSSLLRT